MQSQDHREQGQRWRRERGDHKDHYVQIRTQNDRDPGSNAEIKIQSKTEPQVETPRQVSSLAGELRLPSPMGTHRSGSRSRQPGVH